MPRCLYNSDFATFLYTDSASIFLLSLRGAHIYNIDETPPEECKWTELDCVKVYHDFFAEQSDKFH